MIVSSATLRSSLCFFLMMLLRFFVHRRFLLETGSRCCFSCPPMGMCRIIVKPFRPPIARLHSLGRSFGLASQSIVVRLVF